MASGPRAAGGGAQVSSADIGVILKDLGGQIADKIKQNISLAAESMTEADLRIIQRAGERKAELLLARLLGQDVAADEAQVDATLGFLASKAVAIARETAKNTFLEVLTTTGQVLLKLVFKAVVPIP